MMVVDLVQRVRTHFFRPTHYDWMAYIKVELILPSAIFPSQVPVGACKGTGYVPTSPAEHTLLSGFNVCLPSEADSAGYTFGTVKLLAAEGSCIETDFLRVLH
jgi:hypothetical protein